MDAPLRLSVIVCTWNRAKLLAGALASIDRSDLPPSLAWEVIVVDNNSSDETKAVCDDFARRNPQRYRYLFEKRQGKSFALNTGIAAARGEILAFTDDDVTVDGQWLSEILKIFESFPCIGVGGKIVERWTQDKPNWLSFEGRYKLMSVTGGYDRGDQPHPLTSAPFGANFSLRREAFQKYGDFRTDLGLAGTTRIGAEDTEFGWRMLRAGETLIYAPKAIVFHPVAPEKINKRYFMEWYYALGKAKARIERVPPGSVRYFGIPRYLLRACIPDLLLWLTSVTERRRFFYRLQFLNAWGRLMEEKRLWQSDQQVSSR